MAQKLPSPAVVRPPKNYDRVAFLYDLVADVGSCGAIAASKRAQLAHLRPGDRVLFAGSGTGRDAIAAVRHGCDVTCVDASRRMLDRAASRARRADVPLTTVHADLRQWTPARPFDAVCANHVLNVFAFDEARAVLARLVQSVRPGGLVQIADFAPADGRCAPLLRAHWRLTAAIGVTFGLCDRHGLADHTTWLPDTGLTPQEDRRFAVLGLVPAYRNLVLRKHE